MQIQSLMKEAMPDQSNPMVRYCIIILLGFIAVSCNPGVKGENGVIYKSAIQYNDYIVNRQTTIIRDVLDFSKTENLDSAEAKLKRFISKTGEIITEIEGMPAYRGDVALRDAAVRYFNFFKRVFQEDYTEYLRLRRRLEDTTTGEAEITKAQAGIQDIIAKVTKEEEGYDKDFHNAQEKYAQKNNMRLTENKIQKEIEKASDKRP